MKNNFKVVIAFILGILVSGVSVYATTIINSNEVRYDNSNGMESTDVQNAIEEIYSKTTYGDATAEDILSGKTALVNGIQVIGTNAGYDVGYNEGLTDGKSSVIQGRITFAHGNNATIVLDNEKKQITYSDSICRSTNTSGVIYIGKEFTTITGTHGQYYYASSSTLQASIDGSSWVNLSNYNVGSDNMTSSSKKINLNVTGKKYKYLRGVCTGVNSSLNISTIEWE